MTLRQALERADQLKATHGTNLFGYPPVWVAMRKEGNEWYSATAIPYCDMPFDPDPPNAKVWISHDTDTAGIALCHVTLVLMDNHNDWEVYDHRRIFPGWHDQMDRLNEGLDHSPIAADHGT